jgi:hypothetical protein
LQTALETEEDIGLFEFETREEVGNALHELAEYYDQDLDLATVIHAYSGNPGHPTFFVLYLAIVDSTYYE